MNRLRALLVAAVLMLAGCGAVPVEHYRDERPALDLSAAAMLTTSSNRQPGSLAKLFQRATAASHAAPVGE